MLKTTPDRAGRYWVTFDDGTRMALYRQTVEDFGLYTGLELTEGEYERLCTAAGIMSAKMRAVRIVSASSVSRRDLEDRLVRKGEDPDQAKEAVRWMEDLHLVDDRKTAEQVIHSCISGSPENSGKRHWRSIRTSRSESKPFCAAVWVRTPMKSKKRRPLTR